jgi:hypothetical protein
LFDQDSLSRFGCNEDLVVGFSFLASPRKLSCAKKAACTLGWQHLGKLLWDFAIEGELLELGKAHVTKTVMPLHELGLVLGSCKLDLFGFLGWR